ncbi:hypothetical protein OBBRIDRAFT_787420 [Obba rivulosa]|uniref:Transcription factor IIIC 90kDa subunit N-terminal domain-containing protein n=1 Tax=Obba rivulosa TaxID=1052685 RepID=A0A8E2J793_9APHY|nr:hypothetical protein OBBRIDRAFT_787420 [Obba rivulosa]
MAIPTALSLPAVWALPLAKCLQWSGDGQILMMTKSAVYILTPDAGVRVDAASVIRQAPELENSQHSIKPLGWLRTMIEYDRMLAHYWPADCQEWGAVSLGSVDPTLRAVSPSPSNLTDNASCLIAVLNSNLELTIWGPAKNLIRGKWTKLVDVTAYLRESHSQGQMDSVLARTLQAQVTSIEWSPQADFNLSPTPSIDGSLLATGNRAGCVVFFRCLGNVVVDYGISSVAVLQVSNRLVNQLAWSPWRAAEGTSGICQAYLACGDGDGSVTIVKVTQTLQSIPEVNENSKIIASFEIQEERPSENDGRVITGMKWIHTSRRGPILVYCKAGVVNVWSDKVTSDQWSGRRSFLLVTRKLSVGSSSLCPVSGIEYVENKDSLVVSLSDGSFHVLRQLSTDPQRDNQHTGDGLTGPQLSAASRSVFRQVEPETVQTKDVQSIYGMSSYDGQGTYVWIHEACRPTDFTYKHDAKHISMFVVAQLWPSDDADILQAVQERLTTANAGSGETPLAMLRSAFLHLRDPSRLHELRTGLLQIIQQPGALENGAKILLHPYSGDLSPDTRQQLRRSLSTHLFGWAPVLSSRLKLTLADFCQRHADKQDLQDQFGLAAQALSSSISSHVLRTIIRHAVAVLPLLTTDDAPFVLRIVVQASLPDSPPDLKQEASDLSAKVRSKLQDDQSGVADLKSNELCPACHAQIILKDITSATCPNGHTWTRCSITSYVLSTPLVRTCIGCGRKAFLPTGQDPRYQASLPDSARRSWLVHDLLDASRRCLWCGNNFVTLV